MSIYALAPNIYTMVRGQVNEYGPSPAVWGKVLSRLSAPDGCGGGRIRFIESGDVGHVPTVSGSDFDGASGRVGVFADVASSVVPLGTETGVVRVGTGATDNNDVYIATDGNVGASVKIGEGSIAYEARVRLSSLADVGMIAGLAAPDIGDAAMADDTFALADRNFVGFHYIAGAATPLRFGYRASGQTAQYIDVSTTLVAATWVKLGFYIEDNPSSSGDRIAIFVNNVHVASVSKTAFSAATFPSTAALAACLGVKTGAAANKNMDFSFFGCSQSPANHG